MSISFKSVGHFFATALQNLGKLAGTETVVEGVTSGIPGVGVAGVEIERAAYALLGEVASITTAGQQAAADKLSNAGLDAAVIAQVQALIAKFGQLQAVVKTVAK